MKSREKERKRLAYFVLMIGLAHCSYHEAIGASRGRHKWHVIATEPDGSKRTEELAKSRHNNQRTPRG